MLKEAQRPPQLDTVLILLDKVRARERTVRRRAYGGPGLTPVGRRGGCACMDLYPSSRWLHPSTSRPRCSTGCCRTRSCAWRTPRCTASLASARARVGRRSPRLGERRSPLSFMCVRVWAWASWRPPPVRAVWFFCPPSSLPALSFAFRMPLWRAHAAAAPPPPPPPASLVPQEVLVFLVRVRTTRRADVSVARGCGGGPRRPCARPWPARRHRGGHGGAA